MDTDRLDMSSPDLVNENVEKLAALFPNCVTEGPDGKAIDFDLLRQELSHAVVEGPKERYRLEWPGKREAIVTANLPTTNTLRPVREDSVNFDTTENLYIEGDNLEVLKILQESYLGKIKMIYIDPPYNTGNDFVYFDDFKKSAKESNFENELVDEEGKILSALKGNPATASRYHSNWLSMLYPRLKLARTLLSEDGIIFISIDDNEVQNLRKLCDEIFGEDRFVASFIWKRRQNVDSRSKDGASNDHEYCLVYRKVSSSRIRGGEKDLDKYSNPDNDPRGPWMSDNMVGLATKDQRPNLHYDLYNHKTGKTYTCPPTGWRYEPKRMYQLIENDEVLFPSKDDGRPRRKKFLKDLNDLYTGFSTILSTVYNTQGTRELRAIFDDKEYFDFPKPVDFIKMLIEQGAYNERDIVVDFFSGSATTAHAVMALNAEDGKQRKFIQVQLQEPLKKNSQAEKAGYRSICDLGKERIRRAGKKIKAELQAQLSAKQEELDKLQAELQLDDEKQKALQAEVADLQERLDKLDIGFRVYRLDSSNMQDVYYRPQDYQQGQLEAFADNVKPDRTPDDLLAQIMLDWGLPLSLPIEVQEIGGKQVFKVAGNSLYACFDPGVDEAFAKAIAAEAPLRVVFRDSSFKDDTAKINVRQLLRQLSPETEMKVL